MSRKQVVYHFLLCERRVAVEVLQRAFRSGTLLFLAASIALSCSGVNGAPESSVSGHDEQSRAHITGTGTIRYIDLEGGFYGIVGDDGKKYLPIDLDQQYKTDGLKIRFRFKARSDVMTITMWGIPVEVLVIDKIE